MFKKLALLFLAITFTSGTVILSEKQQTEKLEQNLLEMFKEIDQMHPGKVNETIQMLYMIKNITFPKLGIDANKSDCWKKAAQGIKESMIDTQKGKKQYLKNLYACFLYHLEQNF